jgi:hypothetical protein
MTNTIEKTVKEIATEQFDGFSYVFDTWDKADTRLERLEFPAIVCIMPVSGTTTIRNGKVIDTENIALAFLDIAPRGADGEDNEEVYTRMKEQGARFIAAINASRKFEPIEQAYYDVICERMSSIVSGIMYQLQIKQTIGNCV